MLAPTKFPGKQEGSLGEGWKGVKEKAPKNQIGFTFPLPLLYKFTGSLSSWFWQLLTNFSGPFQTCGWELSASHTSDGELRWRCHTQGALLTAPKPGTVTSPMQGHTPQQPGEQQTLFFSPVQAVTTSPSLQKCQVEPALAEHGHPALTRLLFPSTPVPQGLTTSEVQDPPTHTCGTLDLWPQVFQMPGTLPAEITSFPICTTAQTMHHSGCQLPTFAARGPPFPGWVLTCTQIPWRIF